MRGRCHALVLRLIVEEVFEGEVSDAAVRERYVGAAPETNIAGKIRPAEG